jgi:iron(III) transport system substrate-binding protein
VWVANVGTPFAVKDLQEQGAPIAWAVPKPAGFANSWVGAVLKTSKRPNSARVFLDFVLSPEGQQALNGGQASGSAIEGLQGTLNIAEFRVLQPERFTPSVREEWRKKFEDYFRKQ